MHTGIAAAGMSLLLCGMAQAIELPDDFVDEAWVSGLSGQITGFDPSAEGRVYISEKAGIVRVARNGNLLDEVFLDIRDMVNDRVDRGMLSVAVHPQFPTEPYVYVLYTYDPPELVSNGHVGPGVLDGNGNRVSRLVRYTADAMRDFNVALPESANVILGTNSLYDNIGEPEGRFDTETPSCGSAGSPIEDCLPSDEDSHTIGALRFGADGSLFVSNGDGASYNSFEPFTQMTYDLDSLRGKILRIDPATGLGLSDNPYYDGNGNSNRSRVVSSGLRNPYSMTIHPLTGIPYVGDVGEEMFEEINGGTGQNFGWPCFEGSDTGNVRQPGFEPQDFCQDLYRSNKTITPPLISWQQVNSGGAAMVGDFYFGEAFPAEYQGLLFYADFINGWMRVADVTDPQNVSSKDFATDMMPMTEIRVGADGAVYYASIVSGEIRRIRYTGQPEPPVVDIPSGTDIDIDTDTDTDTVTDTVTSEASLVKVGAISAGWWFFLLLFSVLMHRYRHPPGSICPVAGELNTL